MTQALTLKDFLPSIVAVVIGVIGWVTTHVLALRAQRKSFQNQVLDRARLDVTSKIRDYQNWLSELSSWIRALSFHKPAIAAGIHVNLKATTEEFLGLQSRKADIRGWSIALEDYQIVFPETATARRRLDARHLRIAFALEPTFSRLLRLSLTHPAVGDYDQVTNGAEEVLPHIDDQIALLEDLRIHLQNVTLSRIMDEAVPPRHPKDPSVPRLALRAGTLEIVDAAGTLLDKDELRLPDGTVIPH